MRISGLTLRRTRSPPSRGAWIEILIVVQIPGPGPSSPPSRGAWIEMRGPETRTSTAASPPSRGAWIEIEAVDVNLLNSKVAPLAGGVD